MKKIEEITTEEIRQAFKCDSLAARIANDLLNLETRFARDTILSTFESVFPQTNKWVLMCYHAPSDMEILMSALNELLGCYGVEALIVNEEIRADYLNTGDTYTLTIVRDINSNDMYLTTWGDYQEKLESEE